MKSFLGSLFLTIVILLYVQAIFLFLSTVPEVREETLWDANVQISIIVGFCSLSLFTIWISESYISYHQIKWHFRATMDLFFLFIFSISCSLILISIIHFLGKLVYLFDGGKTVGDLLSYIIPFLLLISLPVIFCIMYFDRFWGKSVFENIEDFIKYKRKEYEKNKITKKKKRIADKIAKKNLQRATLKFKIK